MVENINQTYQNVQSSGKSDFYTSTGKKVGDFVLGFFGIWVVIVIVSLIFAGIRSLMNIRSGFGSIMFFVLPLILLILGLLLMGLFFKMGRRYIAIGILSSSVLPLLVYGACWVVIIGAGGF
jgi:hypothetical protein